VYITRQNLFSLFYSFDFLIFFILTACTSGQRVRVVN